MSVTHEEDRKGAAVVPWLRQSIKRSMAGVVLVADTGTQQQSAKQKNDIVGGSMGLVGSTSAENDHVVTCQIP